MDPKENPTTQSESALTFLNNIGIGYCFSRVISEICTLGIPDLLKQGPLTSEQLVKHLSSPASPSASGVKGAPLPHLLHRLLRAAAQVGVVDEVLGEKEEQLFSLNQVSRYLCEDHPESAKWSVSLFAGRPSFDMWAAFSEVIRSGNHAPNIIKGYSSPYEWFKEIPEEEAIFQRAMRQSMTSTNKSFKKQVDFSGFNTCVDVGGSLGHTLRAVLEVNPNLRGTVLDLPRVIEKSQKENEKDEILGDKSRVSYVGGDFFESVPEADCYIVSRVLHNWEDKKCITALKNISSSLQGGKKGRVFIIDMIMPEFSKGSPRGDGKFKAFLDLHMMVVCRGLERTEKDFKVLLEHSGLKLLQITNLDNSCNSVIEAALATETTEKTLG